MRSRSLLITPGMHAIMRTERRTQSVLQQARNKIYISPYMLRVKFLIFIFKSPCLAKGFFLWDPLNACWNVICVPKWGRKKPSHYPTLVASEHNKQTQVEVTYIHLKRRGHPLCIWIASAFFVLPAFGSGWGGSKVPIALTYMLHSSFSYSVTWYQPTVPKFPGLPFANLRGDRLAHIVFKDVGRSNLILPLSTMHLHVFLRLPSTW